jgi:hypothetical protein
MFLLRWLKVYWTRLKSVVGTGPPLCDSCRFDYGNACTRPERPNARICPDYKRR